MSILRFDPLRDPLHEMDRLTNQLLSGTRTPASLPMDVWRSGDAYCVALDLPGMDENSLDVTIARGALTIRAERQRAFGENDTVLVAERPQGSFSRQLMLGDDLDTEQIAADYRNGVLLLRIPVARAAQPRRVEVRRAPAGPDSLGSNSDDRVQSSGRTVLGSTVPGNGRERDREAVGASG